MADEYYQGRLDWYSVDVDAAHAALGAGARLRRHRPAAGRPQTMIPIPVSFSGMPNTRWWTFEDSKTNFGDIDASTTDLAKLLFMEFALVYANDWFVIPYTLPAGAIATVRGFVVTNVFGERFWIDAGRRRRRCRLAALEHVHRSTSPARPGAPADTSLLLLPTRRQDPARARRPRTSC